MIKVNFSQSKIAQMKKEFSSLVTIDSTIDLYNEYIDGMNANKGKENKKLYTLRNNIISGLVVLGMDQDIIPHCMFKLDLEDILKNYTISEINNMFELERAV